MTTRRSELDMSFHASPGAVTLQPSRVGIATAKLGIVVYHR
jgi:hypothetical protein